MKPCIYINPNAPSLIRKLMDHFPDVPRVSANEAEVEFGGFVDVGLETADYAAVVVDENGGVQLFPFIPS
jgi:hypothetical protein